MLRPVPEITAEQENFRMEPLSPLLSERVVTIRRDPIEPVPVGSYVVKVFRVVGYDPDCDGSLMARLANVDRDGEETGWEPSQLGLDPSLALVVDHPSELWGVAPPPTETQP